MDLEKHAEERKARLAELRNLKRKKPAEHSEEPSTFDGTPSIIKHRNYDPETRSAKLGFEHNPIQVSENETIELVADDVKEQALKSLNEQTSDEKQLNISNLEPKKVNWDLKRDLEPSFKVLDARTYEAIMRDLKERVKRAKEKSSHEN